MATYSITKPLDCRNADGTIKDACSHGNPMAHVRQTQVPLNFPVSCYIKHSLADVKALQGSKFIVSPHLPICPLSLLAERWIAMSPLNYLQYIISV